MQGFTIVRSRYDSEEASNSQLPAHLRELSRILHLRRQLFLYSVGYIGKELEFPRDIYL